MRAGLDTRSAAARSDSDESDETQQSGHVEDGGETGALGRGALLRLELLAKDARHRRDTHARPFAALDRLGERLPHAKVRSFRGRLAESRAAVQEHRCGHEECDRRQQSGVMAHLALRVGSE
jgi:hypothetical protein